MEQIEKEKIQSNKGSSYKLLMEQAKLKQATSKVSASQSHRVWVPLVLWSPEWLPLAWRMTGASELPGFSGRVEKEIIPTNPSGSSSQHFKDLIRLRRTTEWPRSPLDSESTTSKETPEIEPLPFTLSHECCISVVQKLTLFLLSMDFTCHADLLLFVCKVPSQIVLRVSRCRRHGDANAFARPLGAC